MSRRDLGSIKPKQSDVINVRGDIIRGSSTGAAERLAVGTTAQFLGNDGTDVAWEALPTAGDTTAGILETATQAEQETATATDKIVTSGRQRFHPSAAKGWAEFQVDGTVDANLNVSSVTDTATGDWTVNWATDFSSGNYAAVGIVRSTTFAHVVQCDARAAGTVSVRCTLGSSGNAADPTGDTMVIAFGDQA